MKSKIAIALLYTTLIVVITLWLRGCAIPKQECPEITVKYDTVEVPSKDTLKTIAQGKLKPSSSSKKETVAKTKADTIRIVEACNHDRNYDTTLFKANDYKLRLMLKADCEGLYFSNVQFQNLKPSTVITRDVTVTQPKPTVSRFSIWLGASLVASDRLTASGDIMVADNQKIAYKYSYNPFLEQHTAGVSYKLRFAK